MREEELPRIQIYEIEAGEGCTHEVLYSVFLFF